MPGTVRSSDEVPIAFERTGDGSPLIIVGGAIAYREVGPSGKLEKELSHRSPSTATSAAEVRAATPRRTRFSVRSWTSKR